MLRLKLKAYLKRYNLNEAMLADAMAELSQDRDKPVSERYLRYLTENDVPLTAANLKRKPSLVMLGHIIIGLKHLTGEDVAIEDLLEVVTET